MNKIKFNDRHRLGLPMHLHGVDHSVKIIFSISNHHSKLEKIFYC